MNVKVPLIWIAVLAVAVLVWPGSAAAQWTPPVKVSDAIEGGSGGVSAARCGSNVVVGFGDVESGQPNSWDGFAYSKDGGRTFTDGGTLPIPPENPDAISASFLGPNGPFMGSGPGNPVVACSNSSRFYYASVYTDFNDCPELPCTSISVSASNDGGQTWGLPVVASKQSADIYLFGWPSMAVDPTNPSRLYVAYINNNDVNPFDFGDCPGEAFGFGTTILEFTSSSDGGKTWSQRRQLDHSCPVVFSTTPPSGTLMTPNVVVSPDGIVYLTYALAGIVNPQQQTPNEIRFMRSIDSGNTFSAPQIVSTDAVNNAAPKLAVNRTFSPHRGNIYLTWPGSPAGTYTDVLVSESLDHGLSFSFPRPISPTPAANVGRTQANPVIAVDEDGQVQDCFYDTGSNAPTSSSVYSYNCATSFNYTATWQNHRVVSSAPAGFNALTADFLRHHDGFFTAFELQNSAGQKHVAGQTSDNP